MTEVSVALPADTALLEVSALMRDEYVKVQRNTLAT